jgi:hypothetical protein
MPHLFVWAAFIGWASYDHSGATPQAAVRSSAALVFGVLMAWMVAMFVTAGTLPFNAPVAMAVLAGIASFLIVLASAAPILSVVPATFYGFASTFAYLSLVPSAFTIDAMTGFDLQNVIIAMPISLLVGTVLGIAQGRLAQLFVAGERRAAGQLHLDGSPALLDKQRPQIPQRAREERRNSIPTGTAAISVPAPTSSPPPPKS